MVTIEVLGPGCPRCRTLEQNVREAVEEMGLAADIRKVEAIKDIAARGVFMTPGLTVDGEVVSTGRLLSPLQVKKILQERLAQGAGG